MSSNALAPNTSPAQLGADHHTPQAVVERFLVANDALDVGLRVVHGAGCGAPHGEVELGHR